MELVHEKAASPLKIVNCFAGVVLSEVDPIERADLATPRVAFVDSTSRAWSIMVQSIEKMISKKKMATSRVDCRPNGGVTLTFGDEVRHGEALYLSPPPSERPQSIC